MASNYNTEHVPNFADNDGVDSVKDDSATEDFDAFNLWESPFEEQGTSTNDEVVGAKGVSGLSPDEIATFDSSHEKVILSNTNVLHNSLFFCDQIVNAALKVSNFVPDVGSDKSTKFWKDDIIPLLSKNITDVSRARVVVNRSITSVRDLGIAILRGAEIILGSQGSEKAIEIARKNIGTGLTVLEGCIAETMKLEANLGIEVFESQITKLLSIMGPKSAKFLEEKSNIEARIYRIERKMKQLYTELGAKQGEAAAFKHLADATQKVLSRYDKDIEAAECRMNALRKMNDIAEESIVNIGVSSTNSVTTTEYNTWWKWWFKSNEVNTTREISEKIPNNDRDSEREYYENVVLARMKRLKEDEKDADGKKEKVHNLNKDFSTYTAKYKQAKEQEEIMTKNLQKTLAKYQNEIDLLNRKLEDVNKKQWNMENVVGLQDNTLIECLVDIKTFTKSIEKGTSTFSPLVSILSGIKTSVLSDIELLSSDKQSDIFLGAKRLIRQVKFLSSYAVDADKMLTKTSNTPAIENK